MLTPWQGSWLLPRSCLETQTFQRRWGGLQSWQACFWTLGKLYAVQPSFALQEDFEETFEEDDDDDDDVNSPAHQIHRATAKPAVPTTATLPSSDSGSNSPEPNAIAVNVQG